MKLVVPKEKAFGGRRTKASVGTSYYKDLSGQQEGVQNLAAALSVAQIQPGCSLPCHGALPRRQEEELFSDPFP